jgi:probable phosphoglycerate mutase
MTTVVLVRHGETDWNRDMRVQGWAASPLNDRGRAQARDVGRALADDYDVDRLVASDLRRTRETTAHLRSAASFPDPEFSHDWRERCFGAFQGLTDEQVFHEFPEHDASLGMVGLESTPERGESLLDVHERVTTAWEGIVETADPDETVLVVTHGGPIYLVLAAVRGRSLPDALADYHQHNCAINEFVYDHEVGAAEVVRENDVGCREQASRTTQEAGRTAGGQPSSDG